MPPKVGVGRWEARENQGTDTRSGIPPDENLPLWEPFFFSLLIYSFSSATAVFQEPKVFGVRVYLFDFVSLLLVF